MNVKGRSCYNQLVEKLSLVKLHKKYIANTQEKEVVADKSIVLDETTRAVQKACQLQSPKIYVNTKILKHLYDKKTAEEYNFLLHNLDKIVRYPDEIYQNAQGKRGQFCFIKKLNEEKYFVSIEVVEKEDELHQSLKESYIATAFRLRKPSYLKNYTLLWSWKGGAPSS